MNPIFKYITFVFLGFTNFKSIAQSNNYIRELNKVFEAIQNKNFALIKPLIDSNIRVNNYPIINPNQAMPYILNQLLQPVSYEIIEEYKQAENTKVRTRYNYKIGGNKMVSFVFNPQKKITKLDISKEITDSTLLPDRVEIPFVVIEGLLFVKAKLNNKEETFIFDSGAPYLMLNSDYTGIEKVNDIGLKSAGLGGDNNMGEISINSFDLQGIKLKNEYVASMPLNHLEIGRRENFAGLIGYEFYSAYQLTYDYVNNTLILDKTNDSGELIVPNNAESVAPLTTVSITTIGHFPIFDIEINHKKYSVGLDCGASTNLMLKNYMDEIGVKATTQTPIQGTGKELSTGIAGVVKKVFVNNLAYKNMDFMFENGTINALNKAGNLGITALMGYSFLNQYKTVINFKKQEIKIYPK